MDIELISVVGGQGRCGAPEPLARLELVMGEIVSIVGPTGSGKTMLINDIGLFARCNTSGREQGDQQGKCSDAKVNHRVGSVVGAGTRYYTDVRTGMHDLLPM